MHATGDYVWFIDSDDFIESNCLHAIIDHLKSDTLDFVKIEKKEVSEIAHPENSEESICLIEKDKWDTPATAFNIIVKRQYLLDNSIIFDPDIAYGEDTLWVFWVGFFSKKYRMFSNQLYFYRQRAGSAMSALNQEKHLKSMILMTKAYRDAYTKYYDSLDPAKLKRLNERVLWSTQNILMDALVMGKTVRSQVLEKLSSENLYPYPILWDRIKWRYGLKSMIINAFGLFVPFKSYYKFCGALIDIFKK